MSQSPGSELIAYPVSKEEISQVHSFTAPNPFSYSETEKKVIMDSYMPGASEKEALALIRNAEHLGLDVFKQQIHFVKRWNDDLGRYVWSFQTSIHGLRSKAEETGEYEGQGEPQFSFEPKFNPLTGGVEGEDLVSRVTVFRRNHQPTVGVARYSEFVQKTKGGAPVHMWHKMPKNQLAKCAEANGLRKAFPERCGGIYCDDEMPPPADDRSSNAKSSIPMISVKPIPNGNSLDDSAQSIEWWGNLFVNCQTVDELRKANVRYQKAYREGPTQDALRALCRKRLAELRASQPECDPVTGEVVPPPEREPGSDDA